MGRRTLVVRFPVVNVFLSKNVFYLEDRFGLAAIIDLRRVQRSYPLRLGANRGVTMLPRQRCAVFSEMRREPEKLARSFCRPRDYRISFGGSELGRPRCFASD